MSFFEKDSVSIVLTVNEKEWQRGRRLFCRYSWGWQ